MKNLLVFVFVLQIFCFFGCYRSRGCADAIDGPLSCIEQKIEDFKIAIGSKEVVKIESAQGNLYLFANACIDCGDHIYDENCAVVCVTNLEGFENGVPFCEAVHFDGKQTVLWKK